MRDDQSLMKKFVKIIEAYPELYDNTVNGYRSRQAELAWKKVAERVTEELNEECTVDELKIKWKGIRSSFNRYKNKLLGLVAASCKKYYLYDSLRFLDAHTRPKCLTEQETTDEIYDDNCKYNENNDDNNDNTTEYNPLAEWTEVDIKPVIENIEKEHKINIQEVICTQSNMRSSIDPDSTKKRRPDERNTDDDNEDMQFFRSILPDIRNFTSKEKRKLKMEILQLIDDVENERKRHKPNK